MDKEILDAARYCVECNAPLYDCRDCGAGDPLEYAKAIVEQHERYGWHDLRKNPNDLPDTERKVDVMAEMLCKWDGVYRIFPMQMSHKAKIMYGKPIGWGIGYPYDFDFETDEVIAWREIEPFESEAHCPNDYHGGDV